MTLKDKIKKIADKYSNEVYDYERESGSDEEESYELSKVVYSKIKKQKTIKSALKLAKKIISDNY